MVFIVIILLLSVLSSCTSLGIATKGIYYFEGKKIESFYDYYGSRRTCEVELKEDSKYDKIIYYSTRSTKYNFVKTTTVKYKSEKINKLMDFSFTLFNDGCMRRDNRHHKYYNGYNIDHSNHNSTINGYISQFKKNLQVANSYDYSYRNTVFNNSSIGDYYLLTSISWSNLFIQGQTDIGNGAVGSYYYSAPSTIVAGENVRLYSYEMWEVEIVAKYEDKKEYRTITYDPNYGYYRNNTNTIVSKDEAQADYNNYLNQGFTVNKTEEGESYYIYVKDGNIESIVYTSDIYQF